MFRRTAGLLAALFVVGCALSGAATAAVDTAALDKAIGELPKYDWGQSRDALNTIDSAVVETHGDAAARKGLEKSLIGVLTGQATRAAKQYVCRKLAIIGTAASVDALAALLSDEKLSHMGRYALERMPCAEAGKALRSAIGKVGGKLKVGMINSVGAREDAAAVDSLVALLKDSDQAVAAAAAAALGRIGDPKTAPELAAFLAGAPKELKTAAIDANLDLAQRMAKKGEKAAAGKIYDKLYAKDQPVRVRRAALQGLAMVRPAETAPLVLKALGSDDPTFRGLAAGMIREMPGAEATKTFAAALPSLPEAGQVSLLDALAARKDAAAARPAVLKAAKSSSATVAAAALKALGAVGGAGDVSLLAAKAAADSGEAGTAAQASLARLRGDDVNKTIVGAISGADAKTKVVLINALAARTATDCAPAVVKCAGDADAGVSKAAIEAIGALGDEKQVPELVSLLKAGKDAGSIEKALSSICSRAKDKAAGGVIAGMKGANSGAQVVLLNALGRCGGQQALDAILTATKSSDEKVADGAVRVLCNWPDKAAMGNLLDIAKGTKDQTHQILAVRGVVRLARLRETPVKERWSALSQAMELAKQTAEKRQVLGALRDVPTLDALKLVSQYVATKGLAEEAGAAAVPIADRVYKQDPDLARSTLQQVVKNAKNRRTRGDAQKVLKKIGPAK